MTRSEANLSDEVGAEVSAWDGYITGRNVRSGGPATRQAPIIGARLSDDIPRDLDQWAVDNGLTRSAAIRLLIESALRETAGRPVRANVARPSRRRRRDD
jgi:hypothetical protein